MVDSGGGTTPVQAAHVALLHGNREAGGGLAEADARVRARPVASGVAALCPCRIRRAKGVESDR
jgi:hypothetical protein